MRARSRLAWGLTLLVLGVGACTKPPNGPSPGEARLAGLEITGPGTRRTYPDGIAYSVSPGETAQFKATARFGDGSSRDVTSEATWESSNSNILAVTGAGLLTGRDRGPASITANFDGRGGSHAVLVLSPDTYVLGGQVFESRNPPAALEAAHVTVMSGPLAGQDVLTSPYSGYRLFGVSGPTTIRVAKAGYQTQDFTVVVSDHQVFDVDLPLLRPRPELSGAYTLTLTAADDCDGPRSEGHLPNEARQRRYSAFVTQGGPTLTVELSGAAFTDPMPADHRFPGKIEPDRVWFDLQWYDAWWDIGPPRIVERLPTGEILVVDGWVVATPSEGAVGGTLNGGFIVYPAGVIPKTTALPAAQCYSSKHRFVLSR